MNGGREIKIFFFSGSEFQKYRLDEVKNLPWPGREEFHAGSRTQCPPGPTEELAVEYWFRKNHVENHPNVGDFLPTQAGLAKMQTVQEGDVSRKSYKRLHRWRHSPPVAYGNNEIHLHPYKERRLSVAQAMALQSLPEDFVLPPDMSLTDKFKTVGNGIPFLLAYGIAETIGDFLAV